MGVNLGDIAPGEVIELEYLAGRKIAIDAYNMLYQFLSIIRQPDGTPLMDSQGRITSHLSGLFYRTCKLLEMGIKPIYVFDGKPPEIKERELLEREARKKEAEEKYKKALESGNVEEAKIYAQQTTRLTQDMVDQAKKLLDLLGIPWVQAPSEGEAQAAYLAKKGDAWASASQDYDSLLFGTPILIRNLGITGRRKLPRKNVYIEIKPEKIELEKVLKSLGINRSQLIDLAILVGTDFTSGIKGIGPKKALKLVKEGKTAVDVYKDHGLDPNEVLTAREIFLNPPVTDDYTLEFKEPDEEGLISYMVGEFDFSEERIRNALEKVKKEYDVKGTQARLDQWF